MYVERWKRSSRRSSGPRRRAHPPAPMSEDHKRDDRVRRRRMLTLTQRPSRPTSWSRKLNRSSICVRRFEGWNKANPQPSMRQASTLAVRLPRTNGESMAGSRALEAEGQAFHTRMQLDRPTTGERWPGTIIKNSAASQHRCELVHELGPALGPSRHQRTRPLTHRARCERVAARCAWKSCTISDRAEARMIRRG